MSGGGGNDDYDYDYENVALEDVVVEDAGGGVDTITTSAASYTLSANFEKLTGLHGGG